MYVNGRMVLYKVLDMLNLTVGPQGGWAPSKVKNNGKVVKIKIKCLVLIYNNEKFMRESEISSVHTAIVLRNSDYI